jgi:hypothetical protein
MSESLCTVVLTDGRVYDVVCRGNIGPIPEGRLLLSPDDGQVVSSFLAAVAQLHKKEKTL